MKWEDVYFVILIIVVFIVSILPIIFPTSEFDAAIRQFGGF
jgi:hypothetical protein